MTSKFLLDPDLVHARALRARALLLWKDGFPKAAEAMAAFADALENNAIASFNQTNPGWDATVRVRPPR
ncbi:MAG TPA: hypothetical protein VEY95_00255 [Azospirillaceae bacterium]|nr:hypothetical protein [Azospirillaceae bacterium]